LKHIIGNDGDGRRSMQKAKAMIFIEEPEAHLHPEAQLELMKIFSELIKKDIRLIITSHSNYMFHQLNNLIIAGVVPCDKIKSLQMINTANGSIANDLETKKIGIDDQNFVDVAEKLYEEKLALLQQINAEV